MPPPPNYTDLLRQIQYPGMTWVESRVIMEWLKDRGASYDDIDFSVRLGRGPELGADVDEPTRRMAEAVGTKRADIIARTGREWEIIEVKVRVTFAALGQVLGYRDLWTIDNPREQTPRLTVIGRVCAADCGPTFAGQGVQVLLYPQASDEIEARRIGR